jgi:hypothetical protein
MKNSVKTNGSQITVFGNFQGIDFDNDFSGLVDWTISDVTALEADDTFVCFDAEKDGAKLEIEGTEYVFENGEWKEIKMPAGVKRGREEMERLRNFSCVDFKIVEYSEIERIFKEESEQIFNQKTDFNPIEYLYASAFENMSWEEQNSDDPANNDFHIDEFGNKVPDEWYSGKKRLEIIQEVASSSKFATIHKSGELIGIYVDSNIIGFTCGEEIFDANFCLTGIEEDDFWKKYYENTLTIAVEKDGAKRTVTVSVDGEDIYYHHPMTGSLCADSSQYFTGWVDAETDEWTNLLYAIAFDNDNYTLWEDALFYDEDEIVFDFEEYKYLLENQ